MTIDYLHRPGHPALAYHYTKPANPKSAAPLVIFCGGYRSDMEGTKAHHLEQRCRERGQGYIRFDYRGHGASEGRFEDGTIGLWAADALAIIDQLSGDHNVILVGSSMGGWIALLAARDRPQKVTGLVGIAAAPDFTRTIKEQLSPAQLHEIEQNGSVAIENDYSDIPYTITRALLTDGETHCLLDRPLALDIPIKLVQGMNDTDVPWQTAHRIKNALTTPDHAEILLVESGDHRLSRPEDLALIDKQVEILSQPT